MLLAEREASVTTNVCDNVARGNDVENVGMPTRDILSEHLREKCARVKQTLKNINRDGGTDFFIPEDHRRDFRVHCDALEGAMQDFVQAKTWRRKEQLKPPPPPPEG